MTPKEKAIELVDKMYHSSLTIQPEESKQCALIAVDEVITEVKGIVFNYGMDDKRSDTSPTYTIIPYLEQVKNEISKL